MVNFSFTSIGFVAVMIAFSFADVLASDLFSTARTRGRGQTYVAQFWGNHSSRFNPAVLAESKSSFQLRPLELSVVAGQNLINTIQDILDQDFSSEGSDAVIGFIRKFGDKFGDRHFAHIESEILSVKILNLEVMPFVMNSSFIEIRRPNLPKFDFSLDTMAGLNIAYGHDFGGTFKVGAAVRPAFRTTTIGSLTFTDILDIENSSVEEIAKTDKGTGIGLDLSAIWSPTLNWRFGALVQNIGGMGYLTSGDNPEILQQTSSMGMLHRLPFQRWELNLLLDLQHIENSRGMHWSRLLHLGAELGTRVFTRDLDFGVTSGVHDGYLSYGLFADLWIFRLEFAKYGEELDLNPGERGDQRVALSLRTSMSF